MEDDLRWAQGFNLDLKYGYVDGDNAGSGVFAPRLVLNQHGRTVEHTIIQELKRCEAFTFSVAFISPGAIAQLKQHLLDFQGKGRIITSDFLRFNQPEVFLELLNLEKLRGIEVRRHDAAAFHPKGYVFENSRSLTAMIGSSNLTNSGLSRNHEWNLKVSAANGSDLARQFQSVLAEQLSSSEPLTQEWIEHYASTYTAQLAVRIVSRSSHETPHPPEILPNAMQEDALLALSFARAEGARRAIIVSATGTGKTMLSALDVRAFNPRRLLFVVHREQILDRTIEEYKQVLNGVDSDYGKLTGNHKQQDRRFVFATVQTLSQQSVLGEMAPEGFDYIIIDEAHRAAADTYQRVMNHFRPEFYLGMTATPERMDGFNVFELFDHNVPYEIRLNHALEAEMLCPFHYYGVSDVIFDDGTTTTDATQLGPLVSPGRVSHLLSAMGDYAQAGSAARGLIFCSRKDEALALSEELNTRCFRGKKLRTVALTGDDSIEDRETRVAELEQGLLDYILTVDVFNEGVDIPSINQVIMLRQTESAIVFVQQLGRGLRLAEGKDYLVVIDFIGNYSKNFLIPMALFGDESLNRESLRERLNETVEAAALPGLSSVSFDEISRERILRSITQTKLDSRANLKAALVLMQNRTGTIPTLRDFYRFESVDPVLLATNKEHYPALVEALLGQPAELDDRQSKALSLLSKEVLAGKRLHEFVLLELLLSKKSVTVSEIFSEFELAGLVSGPVEVRTAIETLALIGYPQNKMKNYASGIVCAEGDSVWLTEEFQRDYLNSAPFFAAVSDLRETGQDLTRSRYQAHRPFTPGLQYSRYDAAHILGWSRSTYSTIYGVKTDKALGVCAIFVTLEKSEEVTESVAYQDKLLDPSTMRWFTKSNRKIKSADVVPIVTGDVALHVFVKKDDAEGTDHYYLGQAAAYEATETTMPGEGGRVFPVVTMLLRFDSPVSQGLFDYFSPPA